MNAEMQLEPVRHKAVWGSRIRLAVALAAVVLLALVLTSCSKLIRTGQSPAYLVMTGLQGGAGTAGTLGSTLQSDVLNVNPTTQAQSIATDRGQATFELQLKDLGGTASPNSPSPANSITLTQYHVKYIRSDGRNVQGMDVPFEFDGAVTLTVSGTGSTGFTLVRIQAKQEAPLAALAFGGGANSISTIAQVTFYGHDQNGREVSVTGNIEVTFSDWAG
jgi:hypothetical protein